MKKLKIAIVGSTGLVGRTFLKVLEERKIPIESIRLFASTASKGKIIQFKDSELVVEALDELKSFSQFDVALFSAGKYVSEHFAPRFARAGCLVIDNGSFWRMNPKVPLVVPEVNFYDVVRHNGIIANPNCSTIQLVVPLKVLLDSFGLKRVEVSTYQAISGAGQKGIDRLEQEISNFDQIADYTNNPIAFNINFHKIDTIFGSSEEERKVMNETKKILHLPKLKISATCVRIPTFVGHCESVSVETKEPFPDLKQVYDLFEAFPSIKIIDDPAREKYPTPLLAQNTDFVYVGRLRRNPLYKNGLNLWVVADNVRKGAATNAVQILERMFTETPELIFKFKR